MQTMILIMRLTCSSISSVINTLQALTSVVRTGQCVRSPRHLSHITMCGWDYIDGTSGKLLNNTLVEKAGTEEISVIRELGVWEVVDRPHGEIVFGTRWVDNKGLENKPFYRSRLIVQEYKRQADWSFFLTATPPLEALQSC